MFRRRQSNQATLREPAAAVTPAIAPAEVEGAADAPRDAQDEAARQDERLLRVAQRGDLDAFNVLVMRHERAVFNVCLRLLRDVPTAEDAAQDAFVKAWTAVDSFRGGQVRSWLLRIATNRCYDILRARGRRPAASLDAEPFEIEPVWSSQAEADEPPEVFALRRELAIHLERALAALPEDQRLVVILADVQGYDYDTVAAVTGVALGTVKSRLSRARARLREALRDDPASGELFDRYGRLYEGRASNEGHGAVDRTAAPDERT